MMEIPPLKSTIAARPPRAYRRLRRGAPITAHAIRSRVEATNPPTTMHSTGNRSITAASRRALRRSGIGSCRIQPAPASLVHSSRHQTSAAPFLRSPAVRNSATISHSGIPSATARSFILFHRSSGTMMVTCLRLFSLVPAKLVFIAFGMRSA